MRRWLSCGLFIALAGTVLAGCGGTTSSRGGSEVTLTGESLETVQGNVCAVKGHATNFGNLRVNVTVQYEALSATGVVIGTSTASFQIAPFSNFDFSNSKTNQLGQPSSSTFTNGLACSGISDFKRIHVDVTEA